MEKEIGVKFKNLIDRWIGNDSNLDHYSSSEFLEVLNKMKKKEEDYKRDAGKYGVTSESRIHTYVINNILEPLIGKLEYGKRA